MPPPPPAPGQEKWPTERESGKLPLPVESGRWAKLPLSVRSERWAKLSLSVRNQGDGISSLCQSRHTLLSLDLAWCTERCRCSPQAGLDRSVSKKMRGMATKSPLSVSLAPIPNRPRQRHLPPSAGNHGRSKQNKQSKEKERKANNRKTNERMFSGPFRRCAQVADSRRFPTFILLSVSKDTCLLSHPLSGVGRLAQPVQDRTTFHEEVVAVQI